MSLIEMLLLVSLVEIATLKVIVTLVLVLRVRIWVLRILRIGGVLHKILVVVSRLELLVIRIEVLVLGRL
jgi:hypothetical protein